MAMFSMVLSVLMVPPVNTSALVEEYRQLTLKKAIPAAS
jgi:hypothetical protein